MKKRLKIYDFDGTLVNTPSPEAVIEGWPARDHYDRWLSMNDLPRRKWTGWWGRVETLLPPIFGTMKDGVWVMPEGVLNEELAALHAEQRDDEENLVVLMTGRHRKMQHPEKKEHVSKVILDHYGLSFDEYHYSYDFTPTLTFKCNTIDKILQDNPSIEDVEIYEDREPHYSKFWEFIKYLKKQGRLTGGKAHLITLPQEVWQ